MKDFLSLWLASLSLLLLLACGTSRSTQAPIASPSADITDPAHSISLVEHLRTIPGLTIQGSGPNARIRVRGITSINGGNDPLFIVDGQQIVGGIGTVMNAAPVNDIASIRVLKNPEDIGIYGVRGANGVIVIKMKQ